MTLTRTYEHRVSRELIDPETGRRECIICGTPTTGAGGTLRHDDEAIRPVQPARGDVEAVRKAVDIALLAQDRLLPPYYDEADIARVIVEALYIEGVLRTRVHTWRRPEVEQVA